VTLHEQVHTGAPYNCDW